MDLNCSQDAETRDYILVIGGLGFIGSHTTLELLKEGYNVIIVDNMSNSHASAFTNVQRLANKYWESKGQPCPHLNSQFLSLEPGSFPSEVPLTDFSIRVSTSIK
jgi:NAD(P)-dependent dehydrogenase (short-subunit alcohol dehydrogenase family)